MTKTLTEQWKDGDLDDGYYYLKMKDNDIVIDHTEYIFWAHEIRWETKDNSYVKKVLAPVPSYDEYKRLQEQLNEANEVIKRTPTLDVFFTFFEMNDYAKEVKKYLEKWGVK